MVNDLLNLALGGYGAFWAALNTYNFYPMARKAVTDAWYDEDEGAFQLEEGEELPSFDIFLPAYEEGNVIHQAIGSVNDADYPDEKVNLHPIIEEGDTDTADALDALSDEFSFERITVPDEYPGEPNKPRALNYAFDQTDGQIVGIVDVEDIVQENIFEEAVKSLDRELNDYAQGRLHMVNEEDGWLNTMFTGEYGHWYDRFLPSFDEADYPVPLGGTTNFLWRDVLEDASALRTGEEPLREREKPDERPVEAVEGELPERYDPLEEEQEDDSRLRALYEDVRDWSADRDLPGRLPWDPENVTEDFELGLSLWEHDYEMGYLDTTTREESPPNWREWMSQRTRWQKGKLQTLEKYIDDPPDGIREKAHLYMQSAMPHIGPINTTGVGLGSYVFLTDAGASPATEGLLLAGLGSVGVYMGLQGYGYGGASEEESRVKKLFRGAENVATLPAYWGMQWLADMRALKQQYVGDEGWEHTDHIGLERGEQWREEQVDAEDETEEAETGLFGSLKHSLDEYVEKGKETVRSYREDDETEKTPAHAQPTWNYRDETDETVDETGVIEDDDEATEDDLADVLDMQGWDRIDGLLDGLDPSMKNAVRNGLVERYVNQEGEFGGDRSDLVEQYRKTGEYDDQALAYTERSDMEQEVFNYQLEQFGEGLGQERIDHLETAAYLMREDDSEEEEEDDGPGGVIGSAMGMLKGVLSRKTDDEDPFDGMDDDMTATIRDGVVERYVEGEGVFSGGRQERVEAAREHLDMGYDDMIGMETGDLEQELFTYQMEPYEELSDERTEAILDYAREQR